MLSIVGRLRTGVLVVLSLALGIVLGGPLSANGTGAIAATTYTRSASCPGVTFNPVDSTMSFGENGVVRTSSWAVRCNASLPNKAVVTKVQFTLLDDVASGDLFSCGLVRVDLRADFADPLGYEFMAEVPATGGTPGVVRLTDSSISFSTVNNANFAYYVQCAMSVNHPDLGVIGANVIYTISAANG